jgi:hypothetical protein
VRIASIMAWSDKRGGHVVRFVHYAEDYVGVFDEAGGEFGPEVGEIRGAGGFGVRDAAYDTARRWLHGRVVVAHVVVCIQDDVSSLRGDMIDSLLELGKVSLVESAS